jgi:hypothetical protein
MSRFFPGVSAASASMTFAPITRVIPVAAKAAILTEARKNPMRDLSGELPARPDTRIVSLLFSLECTPAREKSGWVKFQESVNRS